MTPEEKRALVAKTMGFKDPDFLKWLDGTHEMETWLMKNKPPETWQLYVTFLTNTCGARYRGEVHAEAADRIDSFLKSLKLIPAL